MPGLSRSRTCSVLAASLLFTFLSFTAEAQIRFDLPAQPLAQALTAIGSLANLNIYFDAPTVDGIQAPALKAELSADDALARLLAGTRLRAVRVDENTIRVVADSAVKHAQSPRDPATGATHTPAGMHLASAGAGSEGAAASTVLQSVNATDAALSTDAEHHRSGGLDEVIVSAQKRDERLQDVPVPVTAISGQILTDTNQLRIEDYYTSVPGLSVTPGDEHGAPQLAIRGITTGGFTNPTVGIVIDDVPYGASSSTAYGNEAPDIDPSDLARVEVLRGPQGTLYGASSIGGLLKYVTVDPSTEALSGRVQVGGGGIYHGDGGQYSARGAINVPLSDTLAIRASAFVRHDPGYIDNVVTGQDGVNWGDAYGGRFSALWRPSDALSLKVSALIQDSDVHGSPDVELQSGLGALEQNDIPGTGWRKNQVQAYSARLTAKIAGSELTFLSGYSVNTDKDSYDFTATYGPLTQPLFGVTGTPLLEDVKTTKFTQEIRLSTPIGQNVEWLLGAFYNHERSSLLEVLQAEDPVSGAQFSANWGSFNVPTTFTDYAAFTDLTLHFTEQFEVQLGGREAENRQTYGETDDGSFVTNYEGATPPFVYPQERTSENSFTYLVTPQYRFSPDLMVYSRLASGYRPGGPNIYAGGSTLPAHFDPDKTQNYEIGTKGDILDHALSFDASVYYISWKDIQLQLRDPTTANVYYSNGSRAKSQGVELSLQYRPLRSLKIATWVAWNQAVLTQDLPATATAVGFAGDRLPNSSRFSGNLSMDQEFALSGSVTASVGSAFSYIGSREGIFLATPPRQNFAGYSKTDLHAGLQYESWTVNLFINNVTDQRAILSGGLGSLNPAAFYYIQPRTAGVSVAKTFQP